MKMAVAPIAVDAEAGGPEEKSGFGGVAAHEKQRPPRGAAARARHLMQQGRFD